MGPWLCSHGNSARVAVMLSLGLASMGPWLCSHGNVRVAETTEGRLAALQWGRGCVATEIRQLHKLPKLLAERFNGAVAV